MHHGRDRAAEHAVLDRISFTALPGQTTAIVGSTGSGKTSLVNLAARLFDVTSGAVLFDGVDVRELDPEILWHRIGVVPQKPYLFAGTVASNLRYGKPDASDDEIWAALEVAQARGATIYGEVLGAASNADAHHITAPAPGGVGAIACMELALEEAGLQPSDIKQINAHGTSTPLNDAAEAMAIDKLFGQPGPPVTSTKGVTGHALGAAGALEAVAVLLSMEKWLIPPTAGTLALDPSMKIDLVMGEARPWEPGPAMSNSLGFGGHNGTIILGPPPV